MPASRFFSGDENRDENVDYYVAKLDELVKKFATVASAKPEQATLL
jgi:hypothetical protein